MLPKKNEHKFLSGTMSKHGQRQAVRAYHTLIAMLILIGGGALLGLGIWLKLSDSGGSFNLDYTGEGFLNAVLAVDIGAIILGAFLLLTGMVALVALSKECLGITFRIIYVILATIVLAALLLVTVMSSLIVSKREDADMNRFFEEAWARTAKSPDGRMKICEIEAYFDCRGFKDDDCTVCTDGQQPECSATPNCALCPGRIPSDPNKGCYDEISNQWRKVFLPSAIVGGVFSFLVLLDILMTSCL